MPTDPNSAPPRLAPDDPRYRGVVEKRFNKRFVAHPDYVQLAHSTEHVVAAVQDAVRDGRRIVVTSGGHCLEGFVSDPDVRVILDVSPMKSIWFDSGRRAVAIDAGATVGDAFRVLDETWGVVVPFGEYPGIGIGGHVAGGAFGFLCRQHGLAADHLYGVEVVTVDADGNAAAVIATREPGDPNRELWWAHTGGGAGNFGVATRFWFRAPGAKGIDAGSLLPSAPESVTTFGGEWSWGDLDESRFARLVRNHGDWSERNAGADSPNANLWALLSLTRRAMGKITVQGVICDSPAADRQARDFLDALGEGVAPAANVVTARHSWLGFALDPFPGMFAFPPGGVSVKVKDALLRRRLTDDQIAVAYGYLTTTDHDVMGGMLGFATYGGRINTVAPDATAAAQRGAILDSACNVGWVDPADAEKNLAWVRAFYRDLFADAGGVPAPNDRYDGALINHPDVDLADPAMNASGVAWHALYYKDNYSRLQRAKARWDPRNVFRHALSVRV